VTKSLSLLAGAAVLAVAVPVAVGQSSGKVAPKQVTRKTTPLVGHRYPWKFKTRGKITLPQGDCPAGTTDTTYCTPTVTKAQGCKGKVRVRYMLGKRVVSAKKTKLKKNCSYTVTQRIRNKKLAGTRLRVRVRFMGNAVLSAKESKIRRVKLARGSRGL
jgi:hypothetical protein